MNEAEREKAKNKVIEVCGEEIFATIGFASEEKKQQAIADLPSYTFCAIMTTLCILFEKHKTILVEQGG